MLNEKRIENEVEDLKYHIIHRLDLGQSYEDARKAVEICSLACDESWQRVDLFFKEKYWGTRA